MAFRPPTFNLWCQVYRNGTPLVLAGYSICQLRGPTSHVDGNAQSVEVLFPKYSDVRGIAQSPALGGDVIVIAGYQRFYLVVEYTSDKGAGFTNEYRIASSRWRDVNTTLHPPPPYTPVVDTTLLPPPGYTPLALVTPLPWPTVPPT